MKRWLPVVLCLLCLSATFAFAQQGSAPATTEDVQQLFDLMQLHKTMDSAMASVKSQMPAIAESTLRAQMPNASPEQKAKMRQFIDEQMSKMLETMPFDELTKAMIPAYQHHFTHAEIQQIIGFYRSPVGKKLVSETPAIMAEYMQNAAPILQEWMERMTSDLQQNAERYARSMKQKNIPQSLQQKMQ